MAAMGDAPWAPWPETRLAGRMSDGAGMVGLEGFAVSGLGTANGTHGGEKAFVDELVEGRLRLEDSLLGFSTNDHAFSDASAH